MTTPKMNIHHEDNHSNESASMITILSQEECWNLAQKTTFARLGTLADGEVFITPLNIVTHENKLYFRTAAGSKLTQLILNEKVTIEFDKAEGGSAYSVNIFGSARLLTDSDEIQRASLLGLNPWVNTEKIEFVEVTPRKMTGRRFKLG
ncbi:MAG: pyridoxamine 5'-phosphate oxidase family protein [Rothia sp. (in: high G+C Gram-positive bacteria)]|nr:pyridoxamine 5'-phosphate oxidase family protein [Rothia sp. (in: high G+C Gram-positive bacteria)]